MIRKDSFGQNVELGITSMNLLVTGGAGFIGTNYIHYMLEKYPRSIWSAWIP